MFPFREALVSRLEGVKGAAALVKCSVTPEIHFYTLLPGTRRIRRRFFDDAPRPRFYRRGVFRRAQTLFRGLRNFPDKSEGHSIPVPLKRRNNEFACEV